MPAIWREFAKGHIMPLPPKSRSLSTGTQAGSFPGQTTSLQIYVEQDITAQFHSHWIWLQVLVMGFQLANNRVGLKFNMHCAAVPWPIYCSTFFSLSDSWPSSQSAPQLSDSLPKPLFVSLYHLWKALWFFSRSPFVSSTCSQLPSTFILIFVGLEYISHLFFSLCFCI